MKRISLFLIAFFLLSCTLQAQPQRHDPFLRSITVTGSATIDLVPDEVHLVIVIKEYFIEELDGKYERGDLRTKVPLHNIERDLRSSLNFLRVPPLAIRTEQIGNRWRETGKAFLLSKQYDITLPNFSEAERLADNIRMHGIESMYIGELRNRNMTQIREQGKVAALKAAQRKAQVLVESLGKRLGDVLEIIEPPSDGGDRDFPSQQYAPSNTEMGYGTGNRKYRGMTLRYEMRARFAIID